jgi:single-strand DNA-binding protein
MNLCVFTGRTTKDIELRYGKDNMAIGIFSLAVDSGYGDNKRTSFFNCTAFKASAENMEKYVKKGTKIVVQAEASQNEYTDRDGNKRSSVNFIVRNWEFAESKNGGVERRNNGVTPAPTSADDFMEIPDGIDAELPFN